MGQHLLIRAAAALLLAACATGVSDPAGECGPNAPCPVDFECNAETHLCVKRGGSDAGALTFVLSVSVTGHGSVTLADPPRSCDLATCAFDVAAGASVSLSATAATGSRFTGWSGDCTGTAAMFQLAVDSARACTATFVDRVTVSASATGAAATIAATSGDPAASCAAQSCTVDKGGSVTLTAPAVAGFHFLAWSGAGCSGTDPALTLSALTGDLACVATYTSGLAVVGTVVGATGSVAATSTSPGAACAGGACSVQAGGTVTLSAPEIPGARFTGWSGDAECTGGDAVLVLANVTHDIACSAAYVARYTVSATVSGASGAVTAKSGDATATCSGASCVVDARGKVTLTAPALPGFRFAGWSGDCSGSDNPLLVANVSADRSCVATFVAQVTVGGTVGPGGPPTPVMAMSGSPNATCGVSACGVDRGGAVTLLAPTDAGWRFLGWSGDPGCSGSANPLVFTNVTAAAACVAGYAPRATVAGAVAGAPAGTLVAATSSDANADCSAGNACIVDVPASVTLTAPAVPGYAFVSWGGAGCPATGTPALALKNVSASLTCTATYTHRVTIIGEISGVPAGAATITVASVEQGADCDSSVPSCTVNAPSDVSIAVSGGDNYRFVGWTGGPCAGSGTSKEITVSATADTTCVATFVDIASTDRAVVPTPWTNPTGWLDETGQPITMAINPVGGATYLCRTGRTKVTGPSFIGNQVNVPCDGGDGTKPFVVGKPVTGDENGTYRTEVRLHIVDYISLPLQIDYYAHDSLNLAKLCPARATTDEVLKAASTLPIPWRLAFNPKDIFANPFLHLTLRFPLLDRYAWPGQPSLPDGYAIDVLSLRHRFDVGSINGIKNNVLVVRRRYESFRREHYQGVSACANTFDFGWKSVMFFGVRHPGNPAQTRVACEALVMNAQGQGYCLGYNADNVLVPLVYSTTLWEKLLQKTSFTPKNRFGCTDLVPCGLYLPD